MYISYIHTCVHACMHAYSYTFVHSYIHTFIHTYIYICISLCVCIYITTYVYSLTNRYMLVPSFITWSLSSARFWYFFGALVHASIFLFFVGFFCFFMFFPSQEIKDSIKDLHSGAMAAPGAAAAAVMSAWAAVRLCCKARHMFDSCLSGMEREADSPSLSPCVMTQYHDYHDYHVI